MPNGQEVKINRVITQHCSVSSLRMFIQNQLKTQEKNLFEYADYE